MVGSERFLCSTSSSNNRKNRKGEDDVVDIQSFRDDPRRMEKMAAMTVQQLRALSRSFGIPARGSKHHLVLALKQFLENEKDGQNDPVTNEHGPLEMKLIRSEHTSSQMNANNSYDEEDSALNSFTISEVSEIGQKRRRGKAPSVDKAKVKVNSTTAIAIEKLSTKVHGTPDTRPSAAKKRGSSSIGKEDDIPNDGVGLLGHINEPWSVLAHKKPQQGWIPYNPRTMRSPPVADGTKFLKLISWNVNGLRALLKMEGVFAFATKENFDVLCLQETKLQEKDVEKIKECLIAGYENSFWTCSVSKLGYSGTAVISRIKPLSVRYGLGIIDHDTEGRLVTVEFDTFYLISGYVPNSGDGLKRLTYRVTKWDPSLSNYIKELEKSKPVILTGDLNCAHQEIDIYNPAGNRRSAGFTDEERKSFEMNFLSKGFIDTFRRQHPGVVGYTYWGYRHGGRKTNKGWRLDYFLVSESIADNVHDSYILLEVTGSDHCPIGLIIKL